MSELQITENTRWKFITDKARFDQQKTDPCFQSAVALSRALNSLRFANTPLLEIENDDSPRAQRTRYNAMFFSCAIYAECIGLVNRMNVHFKSKNDPLFEKLKDATIRNPLSQEILTWGLTFLRNKLVFHFDIEEIGNQLKNFDVDNPVFLRGMGTMNAEVNYELSDSCTWNTLFTKSLNGEYPQDESMERTTQITKVISTFEVATDEFLVGFLESSGWRIESA